MPIVIDYPLADRIKCPLCDKSYSRSSWKSSLTKHITRNHPSHEINFIGRAPCGVTFDASTYSTNHHMATCSDCRGNNPAASSQPVAASSASSSSSRLPSSQPPAPSAAFSQSGEENIATYNGEDNYSTLPYPPRPTKCGICKIFTTETNTAGKVQSSISHHLFHKHGIKNSLFKWRCTTCLTIGSGYALRDHICTSGVRTTKRGGRAKTRPEAPLFPVNAAPIQFDTATYSLPNPSSLFIPPPPPSFAPHSPHVSAHPLIRTAHSQHRQLLPLPSPPLSSPSGSSPYPEPPSLDLTTLLEDYRARFFPPPAPLPPFATASTSTQIETTSPVVDHLPSVSSASVPPLSPPHSLTTGPPSPPGRIEEVNHQQTFWGNWRDYWTQTFSSLTDPTVLDETVSAFSSSLVTCYNSMHESETVPNRPPRRSNNRPNRRPPMRRRPRRPLFDGPAASRIQREFNRFPARAVRSILEDAKPSFSGDVERAASVLQNTYGAATQTDSSTISSIFNSCHWESLSNTEASNFHLSSPPSADEISAKLSKVKNTSPGEDLVEYRHLKAADSSGTLLQAVYTAVFNIGQVPSQWKSGKTVLIHKKGDAANIDNFRPITLLSCIYKLMSAVISQRLTLTATAKGWLSTCQKGFIAKSQGLTEHTFGLSAFQQEARRSKSPYFIAFLDLANAFGSVPHQIIHHIIDRLSLPSPLETILHSIYTNASTTFRLPGCPVTVSLHSGVLQGDALSTILFNLSLEPVIRAALQSDGKASISSASVGVSAFADDIALAFSTPDFLQSAISTCSAVANSIGLRFRPNKCAILCSKPNTTITLNDQPISQVTDTDSYHYLGVPFGVKHLFRPTSTFVASLDKVVGSLLAPWQKIEVIRSFVIPSISYSLASGYCRKDTLAAFDDSMHNAVRRVLDLPDHSAISFFHAARKVGGLGIPKLSQEADIWTLARAVRLLTSADENVFTIATAQISSNLAAAGITATNLIASDYLSGRQSGPLAALRHSSSPITLWSRARAAAHRLGVSVDLSSSPCIRVDEITATPAFMVRAIHCAIRDRHSVALTSLTSQGAVAKAATFDSSAKKELPRLISSRTPLSFNSYSLFFLSRLSLLPSRGRAGIGSTDNISCRWCGLSRETTAHIIAGCPETMLEARTRHNSIVAILRRYTLPDVTFEEEPTLDRGARPDILATHSDGTQHIIEVSCPWDTQLDTAHEQKIAKYAHINLPTYTIIVGGLGTWRPQNDAAAKALKIGPRPWRTARQLIRTAAIEGSATMAKKHLRGVRLTRAVDA